MPCSDNDAGTVTIGPGVGQSTDLSLDTLYLCFGDTVDVRHNGDQRLDGDPIKSTPAGVGYAWYECRPTETGPTKIAVEADRCLLDNPTSEPGAAAYFISTANRLDGNQKFFNDGSIQTTFASGDPKLIWFAPITFDRLDELGPRYEQNGSCVSVSTRAAFAVVYLNAVEVGPLTVGNCGGSFTIDGGLPEYNPRARYDVDISHATQPGVRGRLDNPDVRAGQTAAFTVPESGAYDIVVRDAKGCRVASSRADVTACVPVPEVGITVDTVRGAPGARVCVPVRAAGFTDITTYRFDLSFDEQLLRYDGLGAVHPTIAPFSLAETATKLIVDVTGASGQTVADGDILFEVCFEVLGLEGEFGTVEVTAPSTGFAIGSSLRALRLVPGAGGVLISSQPFGVFLENVPGCGGADANAILIRALDGVPPYRVTYGPIASGPTQGPLTLVSNTTFVKTPPDLPAGRYAVRVEDATGAIADGTVDVADGPVLSVNVVIVSELRCRDDDNGALRAVPLLDFSTPGNPDAYTYVWTKNAVEISRSQTVNQLGVGEYKVAITDTRGCSASGMGTIFSPPPITANPIVVDATCTGPADGLIDLQPAGGKAASGDYAFIITLPGGIVDRQHGPMLSIAGDPGRYEITITDDNGCRLETSALINASREIEGRAVVDSISCFGLTDGQILVTAEAKFGAAPSGPLNFNWSGDPRQQTDNTATTTVVSGLAPGTFTLLLTDADRCETRDTFTLSDPQLLTVALTDSGDESCVPGEDGFAEVTVSGGTPGTPAYTYKWSSENGPVAPETARAEGLSAGVYQVVVVDANGCEATLADEVEIGEPIRPSIDLLEDTRLSCFGDVDGTLSVSATATAAAIDRYEWSNGRTGATITGLPAGVYSVRVFDETGCAALDSAEVLSPDRLVVADTVLTGPRCFQQGDGRIELRVEGGTGPYHFAWTDGTSGVGANLISGSSITAGEYIVTIVDANDCAPLVETYSLPEAPGIDPDYSNFKRASCATEVCDGSVFVAASLPGSPDARFNFVWDSGEFTEDATSSQPVALCGGRNALFIQEVSQRCPPQEFPIRIPAPDPMAIELGAYEDARCFGESSGTVEVAEVFGGIPGYTYEWFTRTGTQTGNRAINLVADTVRLLIRDKDNCPYRDTFIVEEPPLLTLTEDTAATVHPSCYGFDDGAIDLQVSGGNPGGGKVIRWNDNPARNSVQARELPAGTYVAQVIDPKGCTGEATVRLIEPSEIVYRVGDYDPIVCFGDLAFVRIDTAYGGNGEVLADYQVSIQGSSFQPLDQQFQVPGGLPLSVRITDPDGCTTGGELLLESPPAITVRLPDEVEVDLGDSIRLRPSIFPGGAPIVFDSVRWTPDTSLVFVGDSRVSPYAKPLAETTYILTVGDEDGCSATAAVVVKVDRSRNVYIPSAFSPNNDAVNDQLQIFTGPGVAAIESFSVFNRWGELIYEVEDLPLDSYGRTLGWNGEHRDRKVDTGVYVYIAQVTFLDGRKTTYKGSVSVLY